MSVWPELSCIMGSVCIWFGKKKENARNGHTETDVSPAVFIPNIYFFFFFFTETVDFSLLHLQQSHISVWTKCGLLTRKDVFSMEAVHGTLQGPRPGVSHSSQTMHVLHFWEVIPWDFQTHLPPSQPLVSAHLQNVWRFNMWRPETCST